MDRKYLKQFIENCPVIDFTDNGNVQDRELKFDEYIKNFTKSIYSDEHRIVKSLWTECFVQNQADLLIQTPLLRRAVIYFDIAVTIYNFIAPKYIKNRKSTETAKMISVQLQYSFQMFKSIISLTMNGCYSSVISTYRTLYESFVISSYLTLHPELITVYYVHAELVNLQINKLTNSFSKNEEERLKAILSQYGNDFSNEFGWTKTLISNPKDRKLVTLAKECIKEPFFKNLYKASCNYVHPSSLAATSMFSPEFINPFIQITLYIIDCEMTDFILESKVVKREAVVLSNMLREIFDDINHEFFDYQIKN